MLRYENMRLRDLCCSQAALTKSCYQALQARERTAAAARVAALKAEVEEQREKEKTLQHKYEVLQQELAALRQAASA